jgi:hypothetical protein
MNHKSLSGRAELRDLSPAQGIYEVDYILHINVRKIKHMAATTTVRETKSANIRTVGGFMLKNGFYDLEKDGKALYKLEKIGTDWHIISSNQNDLTSLIGKNNEINT